mmetsp:Transcript_3728/g.9425  ORF Transcript_3728/g.9425 Transcript_3728/m.9425 type:complete len:101 (-) Transcript_3728:340-642(-)
MRGVATRGGCLRQSPPPMEKSLYYRAFRVFRNAGGGYWDGWRTSHGNLWVGEDPPKPAVSMLPPSGNNKQEAEKRFKKDEAPREDAGPMWVPRQGRLKNG